MTHVNDVFAVRQATPADGKRSRNRSHLLPPVPHRVRNAFTALLDTTHDLEVRVEQRIYHRAIGG